MQEDPASINKRLDQWEFFQCTPLHWAAWVQTEDVDLTGIWQSVTLERRLITPATQVRFLREELVKVRVVTGQR